MTPVVKREVANQFNLPERIEGLAELAYNLWWSWNPDAKQLFQNIHKRLWDELNHNPVLFLRKVDRATLNAMAQDGNYLQLYKKVMQEYREYMNPKTPVTADAPKELTAYFSFEFGLHESLPVYAGGLGILAGDHLKEASDMNLPLVGLGFIYNQGYFTQRITEDGWQETDTFHLSFVDAPIIALKNEQGEPIKISIELPGRSVFARVWEVAVGRISLYLLDTNLEENLEPDRQLTARLYSNDLDVRISQEILLGMGGVRALRAVGLNPTIWHMNEGHSAFLALERLREMIQNRVGYDEAVKKVRATNIFTTHTPVPAGNDQFPLWLIDKYFTQVWTDLGLNREMFVDLGRQQTQWGENFCMPVLALHLSDRANGVSELHGQVSRKMWNFLFPGQVENNVPITHITNGVHAGTWLSSRLQRVFTSHFGPEWKNHQDDPVFWKRVKEIDNEEYWEVRRHLKRKLALYIDERARKTWQTGSIHAVQALASGVFLEPYSLTIGFARRFATYKRANLIFSDYERLINLIVDADRPVQIIFAGKAHPADEPGKLLIQQVYRAVKDTRSGGRLVFLEDYDINMAHYLVQGVDVWLNNPRRPNEASGTSGMKAAMNGVLNLSVLDGWWREGFNGTNGWAIGSDYDIADPNEQDKQDAESLYRHLENDIIPLFYNRNEKNIPEGWVELSKNSIATLLPQFSIRRMVGEYLHEMYLPAIADAAKVKGK